MEKAIHSSLNKILHYLNKVPIFIPTNFSKDIRKNIKWLDNINENLIRYFIYQVLQGLECMYRNQFIHFDLKPENILLSSGFTVKLCDFSLTKRINLYTNDHYEREEKMKIEFGTVGYLGPEYYKKEEIKKINADRVDMFALGSIFYTFICKDRLVSKDSNIKIDEVFLKEKKDMIYNTYGKIYDENLLKLTFDLLHPDIEKRPDIYELLDNDWINKNSEIIKLIYNTTDTETIKFFSEFQKISFCSKKNFIKNSFCYNNSKNKRFMFRKFPNG